MILEVLKILEGEVNLREETRVAQQAKEGIEKEVHAKEANRLSEVQNALQERIDAVIDRINELPEPEQFGKEINKLTKVSQVMEEATGILATPNTGNEAIAAETEAIELLLEVKRINPKGGGGGGSSPGGGGQGDTKDAAIALLGRGANEREHKIAKEITQTVGETGRSLPEEFRAGLDEYFNRWEQSQ